MQTHITYRFKGVAVEVQVRQIMQPTEDVTWQRGQARVHQQVQEFQASVGLEQVTRQGLNRVGSQTQSFQRRKRFKEKCH